MIESRISKNGMRFFYMLGYKLDHELLKVGFAFHFQKVVPITVTVTSVNKMLKLHATDEAVQVTPGIQLVEVTAPASVTIIVKLLLLYLLSLNISCHNEYDDNGFLTSLMGPDCECHGYSILIVGHSLGGSISALLGIRLYSRFPNLHVYSYGPLPCWIQSLQTHVQTSLRGFAALYTTMNFLHGFQ